MSCPVPCVVWCRVLSCPVLCVVVCPLPSAVCCRQVSLQHAAAAALRRRRAARRPPHAASRPRHMRSLRRRPAGGARVRARARLPAHRHGSLVRQRGGHRRRPGRLRAAAPPAVHHHQGTGRAPGQRRRHGPRVGRVPAPAAYRLRRSAAGASPVGPAGGRGVDALRPSGRVAPSGGGRTRRPRALHRGVELHGAPAAASVRRGARAAGGSTVRVQCLSAAGGAAGGVRRARHRRHRLLAARLAGAPVPLPASHRRATPHRPGRGRRRRRDGPLSGAGPTALPAAVRRRAAAEGRPPRPPRRQHGRRAVRPLRRPHAPAASARTRSETLPLRVVRGPPGVPPRRAVLNCAVTRATGRK